MLVAVDVAEGIPVTFDSYPNEDTLRITEYDQFLKGDRKDPVFRYTIRYDKGITVDQVIASGSFPDNFDYCKILVEDNHTEARSASPENEPRKEKRFFSDGGLMTNTL